MFVQVTTAQNAVDGLFCGTAYLHCVSKKRYWCSTLYNAHQPILV